MKNIGLSRGAARTWIFCLLLISGGVLCFGYAAEPQGTWIVGSGPVSNSYLGIEMEDVTGDNMATYKLNAERGVIVKSVQKGSPAEAATLQPKDVILEYAGTGVQSTAQFARLVRETPVGRKVALGISRDGKRVELSAKIAEQKPEFSSEDRMLRFIPRAPGGREFEYRVPGGRGFQFVVPDLEERDEGARGVRPGMVESQGPRLGVTLQELTEQLAQHFGVPGGKGVLVSSVLDGTPAATAKIQAGDVIIKAGDSTIESANDLTRVVNRADDGEKLTLHIIRDRKEISLTVELAKSQKKAKVYRM